MKPRIKKATESIVYSGANIYGILLNLRFRNDSISDMQILDYF